MKKIIISAILTSLLCSNIFANNKNEGSIQIFISKTMGINEVGELEELFTGSPEDFDKESSTIFEKEKILIASKDKSSSSYSTSQVTKDGVGAALSMAGTMLPSAATTGLTQNNVNAGLIGLAFVTATVASVAIFNGTKSMRDDKKYVSIYRNTVDSKINYIYCLVVSNNELTKEEIKKQTSDRIKG